MEEGSYFPCIPFKLLLYSIWFKAVDLWSQHSCYGAEDYTGQGKEDKIFSGIILHSVISLPKLRYDIFSSRRPWYICKKTLREQELHLFSSMTDLHSLNFGFK